MVRWHWEKEIKKKRLSVFRETHSKGCSMKRKRLLAFRRTY
jgi:hypothetical protein